MDLIVATAQEDAPFAADLERAIGSAGMFGAVSTARVADEAALATRISTETPRRDVVVVVVVSRALTAGIQSLVRFDDVLGTRVDGRVACLAVVRSGAAAPSADVKSICERHGAIEESSTAEDVALQLVGRIARARDEGRPAATSASVRLAIKKVNRSMLVLRMILIGILLLFLLLNKCGRS